VQQQTHWFHLIIVLYMRDNSLETFLNAL